MAQCLAELQPTSVVGVNVIPWIITLGLRNVICHRNTDARVLKNRRKDQFPFSFH